jgi:hypothetical protein
MIIQNGRAVLVPAKMSRKVLVVEDDREIAALIELHLKDLDCEVRIHLYCSRRGGV